MKKGAEKAPAGNIVAEAIYEAARDSSNKFRYPVNTKGLLKVRKLLPDAILFPLIKYVMTK
jgi:hypothetical protein